MAEVKKSKSNICMRQLRLMLLRREKRKEIHNFKLRSLNLMML